MMRRHKIPRGPICGIAYPTYLVYDGLTRTPLGCENCLRIMKEGVIQ